MSLALAAPRDREQQPKTGSSSQPRDPKVAELVQYLVASLSDCVELAESLQNYLGGITQQLSSFRAACIVIQRKVELWDRLDVFRGDATFMPYGNKVQRIIDDIRERLQSLRKRSQFESISESHLKFHKIMGLAKDNLASSINILEHLQIQEFRLPSSTPQSGSWWWAPLAAILLDPRDGLSPDILRQVKNDELLRKVMGDSFLTYFSALVQLAMALTTKVEMAPMSYEEGIIEPANLELWAEARLANESIIGGRAKRAWGKLVPLGQRVIMERLRSPPDQKQKLSNSKSNTMQNFMKLLQLYKPAEFRALSLLGFCEKEIDPRYKSYDSQPPITLILKAPSSLADNQEVASLSNLLVEKVFKGVPPDLARVQLAMDLAVALMHFHMVGWTHGEVTADNVLAVITCKEEEGELGTKQDYTITEFYLSGFRADGTYFRFAIAPGTLPDRSLGTEKSGPENDIDSFGWVLLEIYLWRPLTQIAGQDPSYHRPLKLANNSLQLYSDAFENCVAGQVPLEKPVETGEKRGFFWRVVQPLKECYKNISKQKSLNETPSPSHGKFLKNTFTQLRLRTQRTNSLPRTLGSTVSPMEQKSLTQMDDEIARHRSVRQWSRAEMKKQQVDALVSAALAASTPDGLEDVQNLRSHIQKQGRWLEAEKLELRLMEARTLQLGRRNPNVLQSMKNLASIFRAQNRKDEAQQWETRLLVEAGHGEDGNDASTTVIVESLTRMAKDCLDQRKVEDAMNWQRQAVKIAEKEFGVHDIRTLKCKNVLKMQSFMNWATDANTDTPATSTELSDGAVVDDSIVLSCDELRSVETSLDEKTGRIVSKLASTFSKSGWFVPPVLFIAYDGGEKQPKPEEAPRKLWDELREAGKQPRLVLRHVHSTIPPQAGISERDGRRSTSNPMKTGDVPQHLPSKIAIADQGKPQNSSERPVSTSSEPTTQPVSPGIVPTPEKRMIFAVNADETSLRAWHDELLPRLEKLLTTYLPLKFQKAPVSIDLLGIGTTRESSRPTIVITCDATVVPTIRVLLKKKFIYDNSVFDLKVRKGSVRRSTGRRSRGRRMRARRSNAFGADASINRGFQKKPVAGASIGACLPGEGDLPPASYGGCVLVDGQPYGMTVHHLLDPLSDDEDEEEDDFVDGDNEEIEECPELEGDTSDVGSDGGSFGSSNVEGMPWDSDDEDNEDDDASISSDMFDLELDDDEVSDSDSVSSFGDVAGIDVEKGKGIIIKQPALFDFEDENKTPVQYPDKATLRLGTVYVSSGLRRAKKNGIKHEIDWALLAVEKDRLEQRNLIRGGAKYCPRRATSRDSTSDVEPWSVVPMERLAEKRVHASGRTTGLQGGMISPAMSSLKLPERRTYCRSWHVIGNLGHPGDSGSWVIDNDEGGVCGHVIARCSIRNCAYIAPMELMLEDLKKTLSAKSVELPTPASKRVSKEVVHARPESISLMKMSTRRSIEPSTIAAGPASAQQLMAQSLVRQKDKVLQEIELSRPATMV